MDRIDKLYFSTMYFDSNTPKNNVCSKFINHVFEQLKYENNPDKNIDIICETQYNGDIYDCVLEYLFDIIYSDEYSFEDFCYQNNYHFDDCLTYLQDYIDMLSDVEFLELLFE